MRLSIFILSCLFFITLPVTAEEEPESSGEVTIQGPDDQLINEFRINGQLYMIRVTPQKGAPYYLVDSDGDGDLETRWNELAPDLLIPSWVLLRW